MARCSRSAGRFLGGGVRGHEKVAVDRRRLLCAGILYLLHEPVIVAAAWIITRWHAAIGVKYPALVAVSFTAAFTISGLAVRRYRIIRFLFGMKTRQPSVGQRSIPAGACGELTPACRPKLSGGRPPTGSSLGRVDGQLERLVADAAGITWARRACACWSRRARLVDALYNRRAG